MVHEKGERIVAAVLCVAGGGRAKEVVDRIHALIALGVASAR